MADEGEVIEGSYRVEGERRIEPERPKTRILMDKRFGIYLFVVMVLAYLGTIHR